MGRDDHPLVAQDRVAAAQYTPHVSSLDAARLGCRQAILTGQTTTGVKSVISSALTSEGVSGITTAVSVNGSTATDVSAAASGDDIRITIQVSGHSMSWLPAYGMLGGTLQGQFSLRKE